jgi:uncharacterized SAM-binding protein YcdF (DUF218 family)
LFFYPLGLAFICLTVALFLAWKSSTWTPIPIVLALLIIAIAGNGWVSNWIVKSLEWQYIPVKVAPAEAIVILGGGIKSADAPRPMIDVSEQGDRVIYGAKLYRDGLAPLVITTGGRIAWLGYGGKPESSDMSELLQMLGVPDSAIIEEPDSLNTYQNAVNTGKILAQKGIEQVILVTSAMHMPRSLKIFQKQGIKVIPAPTDYLVSQQDLQEPNSSLAAVVLNLIPDSRHLERTTRAIKEYIGTGIYRLRGWL